jgi:CRISPR-associated protein Cas2
MIEPHAGVFVGSVSAMVRDKLWEKITKDDSETGAALIYSSNTEQGFAVRTHGPTRRSVLDYEGLFLVSLPHKEVPASPLVDTPAADGEE